MAEAVAVIGLTSSIASLVEIGIKIVDRIRDFNSQASDVPESLRSLKSRIPLLLTTLESIQSRAKAGRIPNHVAKDLNISVDIVLEQVKILRSHLEAVSPNPGESPVARCAKILQSIRKDEKIQRVVENINHGIIGLILYYIGNHVDIGDSMLQEIVEIKSGLTLLRQQQQQQYQKLVDLGQHQALQAQATLSTEVSNLDKAATLESIPDMRYGPSYKKSNARTRQRQKSTCRRGLCACSCHGSARQTRALLILSPKRLHIRCDCETREVTLVISALQRLLSIRIGTRWSEGLKLYGSLRFQNTVKRTSPGFLVLEKCRHGLLDFEEARKSLCAMRDAKAIDFADVTPDGDGMLETVIRAPWYPRDYELQFQLAEMLANEGAVIDDTRLLELCLTWVGEGPFVALLDTLLAQCSLDACTATPSLFSKWPQACSPDWRWSYHSGDSFYLYAIAMLVQSDFEFGGTTELQVAVIQRDRQRVEALSKRDNPLRDDVNFRGQTVLHLAVLDSSMLKLLLDLFKHIDIDAQDDRGTTPLMYAISYGMTTSSQILLKAGANPFLRDSLNGFCAWSYALIYGPVDLLSTLIDTYLSLKPDRLSDVVTYCLWFRIFSSDARYEDLDGSILSYLLNFSIGLDILTPSGNNLLHLCSRGDVPLVLRNKTVSVNAKNINGYSPLMVVTSYGDPAMIRDVIKQGAIVDLIDKCKRNALHHLATGLLDRGYWSVNRREYPSTIESAAVLLSSKVKLINGDDCRCFCSLSGCLPPTYLFSSCYWSLLQAKNIQALPILLEFLIVMEEFRPAEIQVVLKALFRCQRFDELGMSHICCRNRNEISDEYTSPIDDEYSYHKEPAESDRRDERADRVSEQEPEDREIQDEERCLAQTLKEDCDRFAVAMCEDVEAAWISILSRRAVMMEEALSKAKIKRDKERLSHPKKPRLRKGQGEVITVSNRIEIPLRTANNVSTSPYRYVDHEKDRIITEFHIPSAFWPEDTIKIEDCVEEHLTTFETFVEGEAKYMEHLDEIPIDLSVWNLRRRQLTTRFLEEVQRLRKATKEERDWDMSVEEY